MDGLEGGQQSRHIKGGPAKQLHQRNVGQKVCDQSLSFYLIFSSLAPSLSFLLFDTDKRPRSKILVLEQGMKIEISTDPRKKTRCGRDNSQTMHSAPNTGKQAETGRQCSRRFETRSQ